MDNMRNKVAAGLLWTYGERITAQVVSLVVSIVLARILLPAEFSVIAIVEVFITVANVFVSDGIGSSLIQKKDSDELDFSTIFFAGLLMSVILYFILFLSSPVIARFYKMPSLTMVIRVMSLRLIVASLNTVQHAYISKHMQFRRFFIATLFGTIISGVVGVTMAYFGFGIWALVVQYMTNTIIDSIVLWFVGGWKPKFIFSLSRLKSLLPFGVKLLGANLLSSIYGNIRTLLIGKYFAAEDLAYYNRGKQLPNVVITNMNTAISKTLFPAMARVQDDKVRFKSMLRKSMQLSAFVVAPMLVGLAACGKEIIILLYTKKWIDAVPFLQILCLQYMLQPIHKSNLQAIKAVGRSDVLLQMEIIKKSYGIVLILLAVFCSHNVIFVAWSGAIASFCDVIVHVLPNRKLLGYSLKEQCQDFLPPMCCAGIMFGVVKLVEFIPVGNIAVLLIQIFTGALVYLGLVKFFKLPAYVYCKATIVDIIQKKRKKKQVQR